MILLFGLRWLRKAILRAAGLIALHDEEAAFAKERCGAARSRCSLGGWDKLAFAAAFHITMLEGTEVVFIVIALGAGGRELMWTASLGAVAALLTISAMGVALHRPLARVPENTLKFVVGVLLSAFGTFWVGEGAGIVWPGDDLAIPCSDGGVSCGRDVSGADLPQKRARCLYRNGGGLTMRWHQVRLLREILGLFVDDGSFAIAILVWLALVVVVLPRVAAGARWAGLALFAGLAVILIASVLRFARSRMR